MRRSITLLGILAASFALLGCRSEGGIGYSADSYTYVSRTWEPKTISVIDTRTGETIWTLELPVSVSAGEESRIRLRVRIQN